MAKVKVSKRVLGKIEGLLAGINPEVDFDTFHEIMGLIYTETYGSCKGFELLDSWYCLSSEYPGFDELADIWLAYKNDDERYFGMGRLTYLARYVLEAAPTDKPKTASSRAKGN